MANPDTFLTLTTEEEKKAIEKISAFSGVGEKEVKAVFKSLFSYTAREIIEGKNKINIPYFMDISFTYKINEVDGVFRLQEKFSVKASEPLHQVIVNTHNGKQTWLHSFLVHSKIKSALSWLLPVKQRIKYEREKEMEFKEVL